MPISSRLHAREAADIVERSHARACFVDRRRRRGPGGRSPRFPCRCFGEDEDGAARRRADRARVQRAPTDDAWIFFTSGHDRAAEGRALTTQTCSPCPRPSSPTRAEVTPRDSIVHVAALSHASGLMSLPSSPAAARRCCRPPAASTPASCSSSSPAASARASSSRRPLLRRLCRPARRGLALDPARLGTILVGAAPVLPADLRAGVGRSARACGTATARASRRARSPPTASGPIAAAVADGRRGRPSLRRASRAPRCACAWSTPTTASCRRARWARSWSTARP